MCKVIKNNILSIYTRIYIILFLNHVKLYNPYYKVV